MKNFLFSSKIFKGSRYGEGHPLNIDRVWPSLDLLKIMNWVSNEQLVFNEPASIEELTIFHDIDYLRILQKAEKFQDLDLKCLLRKMLHFAFSNLILFKHCSADCIAEDISMVIPSGSFGSLFSMNSLPAGSVPAGSSGADEGRRAGQDGSKPRAEKRARFPTSGVRGALR